MPKRATGENTTETTNPMTWHARGCAIYASGEIAGTWSKVQCPVPDWWLADPQKTARHTFDKQKRALICERALQEVMARDWFGDLRAIDNAAVQIAREAAAEVGAPPDAVADPPKYQPKPDPAVGDVSSHVEQVVAAVRDLSSFEQWAVLKAAADELGLETRPRSYR